MAANSTTAAYSEDGVTWTAATLPSSAYWYSVTYGNGRFVAVAANSTTAAYSEDGITWTAATLPSSADWRSVTYGNGKFVAVAANSTTAAYSEDGVTWTQTTLPRSAWWNSVTYDNGKFVAVAQSSTTAAYSEDGITWHDELKGLFQDGEDITTQVAEVLGVPTDAEKEAWNAKADATELSTLQSELSNKSDSDHTHSNVTPITTAGDGAAYTATVPDITALTAGVSFTMIPHTASTSQTATLNVNGLGAKALRRPLSVNNTTTVAPSTTNWLYASKPVRVMYNGTYWIVMDMPRPNAPDIYGTVAIENGGTGATDAATALTNLGITATADELNYMDGVTSNVQTQISQLSSEIADKEDSGTASALINRTTNVNAADTNYTTLMARGEKLLDATTFDAVTDWSEHLVNGAVAWRYE